MPDPGIAQFTSVFRASDAHRVKRCRQTVSCTACQRRKSRCDRQHPCGACEKRGCGESCSYGSNASSSLAVSERNGGGGGSRRDVQMRLNQLEQMVRGLAEKKTSSSGSNGNGRDKRPSVSDRGETETSYHGATSWTALVESIRDIQDILAADGEAGSPGGDAATEPELLLGGVQPITIKDVVDSLPSRQDADKLVLAYFKAKFVAAIFVHTHHFKRRYDAFWADASSASFLWTSILFSILSIGTMIANTRESSSSSATSSSSSSSFSSSPPSSAPDSRFYMAKSAQCLLAGRYLDGNKRLSVEALLMHAHARNVQKLDSDSSLWSLYGLAARLAQKQGYHRDTKATTTTPFEAEMRRRTWFLVQSTDLLFSFQNGMPPIISQDACDVRHPTNLLDDDFDEDCASLPPPRPPTDPHPILAYIVKSHLCAVMRRVVRHVLAVAPAPYADTLALNRELDEWHDSVPACLRIRTIRDTAFTDPNYTIMHRLMLELMYLKSLCILHRPYLTSHKHDPEYTTSRQICRESALKVLEIQAELDVETARGGRMYQDRFMVSNLTLHHFLLAAMIICLDLSESADIDSNDRLKRITTLRTAHAIWSARSTTSAYALHASRVLRAILNRIDSPGNIASSSTGSGPVIHTANSSFTHNNFGSTPNDHGSALSDNAMQQIMPLSGNEMYNTTADETLLGQDMGFTTPTFEDMFDNIDMLDWSSLDQYIQSDSGPWRQPFPDTSF
ncbi:hypothetical protein CCMA1212_003824 [Trichoderma ghanense]|uniref:Zn(2)-C6 fungal-type domain-containing protein n=1 Tax=Trichoderma ghanense TaxID=65468 RepID=A0ABY2H7J5_9HYPO